MENEDIKKGPSAAENEDTPSLETSPSKVKSFPPKFTVGKTVSKKLTNKTIENLNIICESLKDSTVPDSRTGEQRNLNLNEILELSISWAAQHRSKPKEKGITLWD